MMPIRKMTVKQFRGLHGQVVDFEGRGLNAIIGQNASMKTTILGMIASSFALKSSVMAGETMLDGTDYGIRLSEKFKFSSEFDQAGSHEWTLELNNRISNSPVTIKSYSRPNGSLRFWTPGARDKGDTLIQCPALYLSLKRLSPIGEEKILRQLSENMTDEEKRLFRDWHNEILISTDSISDTTILTSNSKTTIAPKTEYYDGIAISAGQDNIGKIILAILSVRRLKEKYGKQYPGAVICIDELESTLYPASQIKMVNFLEKMSREYSIQFFFTTHSMTIVRALFDHRLERFVSVNYAKKTGSEVIIYQDVGLQEIENDLYILRDEKRKEDRIRVYCEDEVGTAFTKSLVGRVFTQKEHISYENSQGANIGYTTYLYLLEHKIPEFLNSIIILDGDVRQKSEFEKLKRYKNVVLLPGDSYPEKVVFDTLHSLAETDSFWDNRPGGYSKQACFMNYTEHDLEKAQIKRWFKDSYGKKGRGYQKLIERALKERGEEKEKFLAEFTSAYNYILSQRV